MTIRVEGTVRYPSSGDSEEPALLCVRCQIGTLERGKVRSALWCGDRLVVVRSIPAMVCSTCGEEYVDGVTARRLEVIRSGHNPSGMERMIVPVFDFQNSEG